MSFSLIRRKQKLTRTVYIDLLKTSLLPECRRVYQGNDDELLQYSTPSHHAKVTQQFLRQKTIDFIAADEWASHSPDINSLDYCIWDILAGLRRPTTSVCKSTEPQRNNRNKWKEVTIETVQKSIAQWNKNLAIANRSRVSCAHNTLRAFISLNITP